MEKPKISVIVIIYQVEIALRQCLNSILAQTYKNLEIILVVGIGKDNCEAICDEYAEKDARIKLIKDMPKGVAVARNQGLCAVTGDYIGFVDGDDWIDPDMFQVMVEAALEHDADISVVGKYMAYSNGADYTDSNQEYVLSQKEAYEIILYQEGFFLHLWDKLYKREVFEGVSFPVGSRVEDRKICFGLLDRANKIVYNTASKYHFRMSVDSGSQVIDNLALSLKEDEDIVQILKNKYPDLQDAIEYFMIYENISVIQNNMLYGIFDKKKDRKYLNYVKQYAPRVIKNPKVGKGVKLKILLCMFNTSLLKRITIQKRKKYLKSHILYKMGIKWDFSKLKKED